MANAALDKFILDSDVVIAFNANFDDVKDQDLTVHIVRAHRDELKRLWEKVQDSYEKCLMSFKASKTSSEDFDAANGKYSATFNAFALCSSAIQDKLDLLTPKLKPEEAPIANSDSGHNLTLPPCDVDTFSGGYLEWPKFRELFTALYIKSSRLSNVERLCHLIRKTSGEANEIVSKYPLSDIGFELAWGSLRSAYENPRMLVNNQLKSLFSIPKLDKETAAGLKGLQRGINSCLSALAIYNVPTQNWDPILIFMCIQRLPTVTINFWEQSVKNKSVLSVWNDFDKFLTERIHTLECVSDLASASSSLSSSSSSSLSNKRSSEQRVKAHVVNSVTSKACIVCRGPSHFLRQCKRFKNLSVSDRYSTIKRHRCCVNCFSTEHEVKNCTSSFNCSICNKRHHTMLHRDTSASVSEGNSHVVASPNRTSISTQTGTNPATLSTIQSTSRGFTSGSTRNHQVFHVTQNSKVLLGTAMVNIVHQGMTYPARALIDPAAETSFIAESLQNRLKLTTHSTNVRVSGINQVTSAQSRKLCPLRISSHLNSSLVLETVALVLPNISGNLPSFEISSETRSRFENLTLADPHFYSCRPVDLLLGADLYPQIITGEIHRDVLGSLIGQRTVFGWIITGPLLEQPVQVYSTSIEFSPEDTLNSNILRFWELEETPKRKILSPSDKFCEENYRQTTRRDAEGRYVVTLPFKPDFPLAINLGSSRNNVRAQYNKIESYLSRKPEVKELYNQVLREYLDLHHMKIIRDDTSLSSVSCYLPHHPVIKPDSKTTKLRVVFNASNKTSNGISLNDCLYVGPTLQSDLVLLILRWRLYRYVFNCDITQMYRQIRLDPAHTPYQRIFFRDSPTEAVEEYELQTVTFGVNCAPFLAIRTLLQLANDSETEYPIAAHILRKCMYVDDVLTGSHDVSSALQARDELRTVLSSAKFELRKWTSNDIRILDGLSPDILVDSKLLTFVESSSSKTLGIMWNAQLDSFYFRVEAIENKPKHTKREVLSTIARLYDPVGWLGPVIVTAKIIMQRVWQDQIDWDDFLPEQTQNSWNNFASSYTEANNIQIPRWVQYSRDTSAELHVFSDASEKAYAGVIYIRISDASGVYTHLLSCKTKVAPLKSISLPRLELCGAVLASELLKTVLSEIDINLDRVYCWTDSTIVLCWLKKPPQTWTTFVANRVCRIQENVGQHNWYHVSSEDNPADLGSRGVTPSELKDSSLWWHGPTWLREPKSSWKISDLSSNDTELEAKVVKAHTAVSTEHEDILDRFSSLDRALRVISYMFRFIHRVHPVNRNKHSFDSKEVTSEEIQNVKLRLAILAQKVHYSDEYQSLQSGKNVSKKSSLVTVNPFLDSEQIMRVNGRLAKSTSLSYSERHPIILPYSCRFSRLLVDYTHKSTIHGGNQLMLRTIRSEYWIPKLKNLVRATTNGCKRCIIYRKRSCNQIMAALPSERTTLGRPFTNTGVDFAGPFDLRNFTGRACKITKGYVCIFVCFATKAVHLEATSDLSTDAFLAAFHRFIARRGCPSTMFSDNGTNFVGASREIDNEFKTFLKECQARLVSSFNIQGLSWRFIPAGAPHMGGLWEAAVKSFKTHFRKESHSVKYTFEELSTILARIEACLNSRPLCPMSDNPDEELALTPGHFLIGSPILAPPEPSMYESPIGMINRYRKMKAFTHEFCRRWKDEYLANLHKRYKWKFPERDVSVNDIVVIRNEQLMPTAWKLGVVIKIYPGTDGHVRVADIKTENGVVKRPITKLVVLTEQ